MPINGHVERPTIEQRIARGIDQNGTAGGAIVPFPADSPFDDPLPMLPSTGRVWLASQLNGGFRLTPYVYRSQTGLPILAILRLDRGPKEKVIRPIRCERVTGTVANASLRTLDPLRPLFNLDRLAAQPDLPVLVVEGEKTAIAAQLRFPDYVATTWPGGAKSVRTVDLSPVFGRDLVIWPDNDPDGRSAARFFAEAALGMGARSVKIVQVPAHFPPKWDLADAQEPADG